MNKGNIKELELEYQLRSKEQSTIRVNYMALPRLHMQVATLIGGNGRIIRQKDMEHKSGLMETDTLARGC